MYARTLTSSLFGLSSESAWVEVDCENGLPAFSIVGLANQSVKEARERIQAAVCNCGLKVPPRKITVNLTPANRKKDGSHYDLPIAVALLLSCGTITPGREFAEKMSGKTAFLGELTLDGKVLPVEGVLPMVIGLQRCGVEKVVLPAANVDEAVPVKGMKLIGVENLREAADFVAGFDMPGITMASGCLKESVSPELTLDFSEIKGQESAKRAAQVAAAGMHGMLMIGPPGVGKSMIGKRIPGIMPPLNYSEQLEVTQIYSIAGELNRGMPMVCQRPYRAPHHSISTASLVGGGGVPRPGEISLAHSGVLFLDELPEFPSNVLDMLRQPLEDGCITITRASGKVTFPSRFMLVGAMNPCRCGYYGDPVKPCTCSESDRQKYVGRLSGPLLDRIDIFASMDRVVYSEITAEQIPAGTDTASLRKGVIKAAEMQKERFKGLDINCNSQLTPSLIKKFCSLDPACSALMETAFARWNMSARSYHRVLKVARSAADIEGSDKIREEHILEALAYRMPERFFK